MKNRTQTFTRVLTAAIILLGLSCIMTAQAQSTTVAIAAPDPVAENSDFTADVEITDVIGFDAANYDITFDPTVLEVSDVTTGLIDGTTIPVDMWGTITPGTIRVIQNVPGLTGVSGSGYLARVHFHVIGSAGEASALTLSNGVMSDSSATEIPASWISTSVDVTAPLDAAFSVDSAEGTAGVTVFAFADQTTGGTPAYTYEWDFGDGTVDVAQNPTHVYVNAGTYTVTLTVTDSLLTTNDETKVDYITVYEPLDAGFSADALEGVAGHTVFVFTDETSGGKPNYSYQWDFGDGATSTLQDPTHVYADDGTYAVTLTVTDDLSGVSSEIKADYISVYNPGDANKDGSTNSIDVTKIERIMMTLDSPTPGADANYDGSINALDITQVELIMMGG